MTLRIGKFNKKESICLKEPFPDHRFLTSPSRPSDIKSWKAVFPFPGFGIASRNSSAVSVFPSSIFPINTERQLLEVGGGRQKSRD